MMVRCRVFRAAILAILSSVGLCASAQEIDHFVPVDKGLGAEWETRLYEDERRPYEGAELETVGMPCGGICAGQLYVRGDGTLAHWRIANDAINTGYGARNEVQTPLGVCTVGYQAYRPESPVVQGAAVAWRGSGGEGVRVLSRDDYDRIRFFGEYPMAEIHYGTSEEPPPPIDVSAEVFSPLIPLNTRDSAIPATVLRYRVANRADVRLQVALGMWLQNPVGLDFRDRVGAAQRNSTARSGEFTAIRMTLDPVPPVPREEVCETVIEDFEDGTYEGWTVEGEAFGDAPATGAIGPQNPVAGYEGAYFVNTFLDGSDTKQGKLVSAPFEITEPYLSFLVGGGNHPGGTCMNLLVDGDVVRTVTGVNDERLQPGVWDVGEFAGRTARLEIVDAVSGGWGHINVDRIVLTNVSPLFIPDLPPDHPQQGSVVLALLDPEGSAVPAWSSKAGFCGELGGMFPSVPLADAQLAIGEQRCGAVWTTADLPPGATRDVVFVVAWYFPNRRQNPRGGPGWGQSISGGEAVGNMYVNMFDDSLDVVRYVTANLERLERETQLFRDTYFDTTLPYWFVQRVGMPVSNLATETCQWWADGRFWCYEGVGCCHGTCTHVWNYEQAVARLFPELDRSAREMQDLGPALDASTGLVGHRGAGAGPATDGQAGTILKIYREHLMSPDDAFLRRTWPRTKLAIDWLLAQDGDDNGLIEGQQPNTYDISFFGPNTFVGSLYLAALRAGEEMASAMGDAAYAQRLRAVFESGRRLSVERLWNGEYFIQEVDLEKHPDRQYANGCLADQMFGQGWARQLGLGLIYPETTVVPTLQSIWRSNWAPDVGPQNAAHPPERVFADPGEAGLFLCTWPKSRHPGPKGVLYRNEIWTGIEYQVAGHMLYEGMVEEALSIVRAIHDRYDGAKHNPWNEIECGDHYARAFASWGCLLGACGFEYDGPAGRLAFAPKIGPEDFKAFFTGAEGWGSLVQKRSPGRQVNEVQVKWGRLRLTELDVELPESAPRNGLTTAVCIAGRPLEHGTELGEDGRLAFVSAAPVELAAGEALAAEIRW